MKSGIELINDIDDCILKNEETAFWWLGQLGYVIKMGEIVIYLDVFLADWPGRKVPPLLKPEEIVNADFIMGTHDHIDHIDREVWHQLSLSSPNAKFVVPKLHINELSDNLNIPKDRFIGLDDGLSFIEKGLKISAIPAAHEFLDQDPSTGFYPYLGYIIEGNGCTLYHAGDTCMYEGIYSKLRQWNKFDVMFLPINGRDAKRYRENLIGNITYQEAVDLAGVIKPNLVVPGHYEMFTVNSVDPSLFADYIDAKYPNIKYWIGNHGEKVKVSSKNR